jgi:hypothetical protein
MGNGGLVSSRDAHVIEEHHHSRERWLGKHASPTGTDWADDVLTPFVAISGSNAYGADADDEAEVLGTDDTPIISGMTLFSEFMVQFDNVNPQLSAGIPVYVQMPRLRCGIDKVWIQAWNATDNSTISFTVGVHEYDN